MSGFSPLEHRALLAVVSLIRDRERDRDEWTCVDVPLSVLYDRLYIPGEKSYELERRNQRQAQRRALGRLHERGLVAAIALAWVNLEDESIIRWQGGGSKRRDREEPAFRSGTPRWRAVGLTEAGIVAALALEQEQAL